MASSLVQYRPKPGCFQSCILKPILENIRHLRRSDCLFYCDARLSEQREHQLNPRQFRHRHRHHQDGRPHRHSTSSYSFPAALCYLYFLTRGGYLHYRLMNDYHRHRRLRLRSASAAPPDFYATSHAIEFQLTQLQKRRSRGCMLRR